MQKLQINATTHIYPIYIQAGIRHSLSYYIAKDYDKILVITDENVATLYLADIRCSLHHEQVYTITLPPGEHVKQMQTFYDIHTKALQFGLTRQSLIIALGGGVIGDLAGFVAATYMRGIDYIQMPTTILAHDSSVGGKVAINHEYGKNLIGQFYSPQAVIYDMETLQTLPLKEVRSGYAELLKEALIAEPTLYNSILSIKINNIVVEQLKMHVRNGIMIKANLVEKDEKEANERKYLNFGHTLGHALETTLGYGSLAHGEAVAIGILFAMFVSEKKLSAQLPTEDMYRWLLDNDYPIHLQELSSTSLVKQMKLDKKVVSNHVQMVLLQAIGKPVLQKMDEAELEVLLEQFFKKINNV